MRSRCRAEPWWSPRGPTAWRWMRLIQCASRRLSGGAAASRIALIAGGACARLGNRPSTTTPRARRQRTIAASPSRHALASALEPLRPRLWYLSSSRSKRRFTTATWPFRAAPWRGVLLLPSACRKASAPWSNNSRAASTLPFRQATCNGEQSLRFLFSIFAPRARSSSTTSSLFAPHATISGVLPQCICPSSILAPRSSSAATILGCPQYAASVSGVSPFPFAWSTSCALSFRCLVEALDDLGVIALLNSLVQFPVALREHAVNPSYERCRNSKPDGGARDQGASAHCECSAPKSLRQMGSLRRAVRVVFGLARS